MALYAEIMNTLIREIENGKYMPDSMLPSEKDICKRFAASRTSVRNALNSMQQRGYINRKQGSGSFVTGAVRQQQNPGGIVNLGIILNHNQQHSVDSFTSNPFFGKKFKGVREASIKYRANPSMFIYDDSRQIEESLFAGYQLDGFLDMGMTISPNLNRYFIEHDCKVCSVINSFHLDEYRYDWSLVVNDYLTGIRQAAKFYREQEFTKFGFFAIAKYGIDDFRLYQQELHKEHCEFDINSVVLFPYNPEKLLFSRELAEYFIQKLFNGPDMPEVLFTDGHFIAEELVSLLSLDPAGRDILQRLRICVIADPFIETISGIENMDFVIPDHEQVGFAAAENLIKQIKGEAEVGERIPVPSSFVSQEAWNEMSERQDTDFYEIKNK